MTTASQPPGAPGRWRKRPVTVEARQFSIGEPVRGDTDASGGNGPELAEWCGGRYFAAERSLPACILVQTLEGPLTASPGDWIVKGSRGEFWPVRSGIFTDDYQAVTEPPAVHSAAGNLSVAGYCPLGCGRTLFLGDDGLVTCSWLHCPRRSAAGEILDDSETGHIVTFGEDEFTVRHPLRERLDDALMACALHVYLADLAGPPVEPGTYRAGGLPEDLTWERVR